MHKQFFFPEWCPCMLKLQWSILQTGHDFFYYKIGQPSHILTCTLSPWWEVRRISWMKFDQLDQLLCNRRKRKGTNLTYGRNDNIISLLWRKLSTIQVPKQLKFYHSESHYLQNYENHDIKYIYIYKYINLYTDSDFTWFRLHKRRIMCLQATQRIFLFYVMSPHLILNLIFTNINEFSLGNAFDAACGMLTCSFMWQVDNFLFRLML